MPDNIYDQELDYIRALYEVFAEKLKRERFTNADIPLFSKGVQANYCEQRAAYYSALSIEHSVRDVFDDDENEFQKLKEDAWHGINTIYIGENIPMDINGQTQLSKR